VVEHFMKDLLRFFFLVFMRYHLFLFDFVHELLILLDFLLVVKEQRIYLILALILNDVHFG
jgi:hypothetical protein